MVISKHQAVAVVSVCMHLLDTVPTTACLKLLVTALPLCVCCLQEGDSWTVVFRDAEDAVAFSLQVGSW